MVAGDAALPGSVEARYHALTNHGGRDLRATYYLVRRHLGYGTGEWDALAWWEQRLYIEGLEEEFNGEHQPDSQPSDTVFSSEPGEMSRVGFTERDLS